MLKNLTISNFDSIDESRFAECLKQYGVNTLHYQKSIELIPAFKSKYRNYKATTYNPDFCFNYKGRKIFVEIKGYMYGGSNNMLRYKLFDKIATENGYEFYMVKYIKKKDEFYFYSDRGRVNRNQNIKTFWEKVGMTKHPWRKYNE